MLLFTINSSLTCNLNYSSSVFSYAPWCPACKANEAEYEEFAGWSDDLNIKVAVVDITREPGSNSKPV